MGNVGELVFTGEKISLNERIKNIHLIVTHIAEHIDNNFDNESSREIIDDLETDMQSQFNDLDQRIENQESLLQDLDQRIAGSATVDDVNNKIDNVISQIEAQQSSINKIEKQISLIFDRLHSIQQQQLSISFNDRDLKLAIIKLLQTSDCQFQKLVEEMTNG